MSSVRLDFATKELEADGASLGRFVPCSRTEGAIKLGSSSYTYLIQPLAYGERIAIYVSRQPIAVRECDIHDGTFTLSVGDELAFDLKDRILYSSKGPAGTVVFSATELRMEFNAQVPAERLGLVASLVALDTMWANLVGFTRTKR